MLTTFLASSWIDASSLPSSPAAPVTSAPSATTTTNPINQTPPLVLADDDQFVQNRMLHYGVYCGPGPADAFAGAPPVDSVDRVCQVSASDGR